MKLTQPQFLFIMRQLPIRSIEQKDNTIIIELIPNKVYLTHEYDDDGKNHIYLSLDHTKTEILDHTTIKDIFVDSNVTLESAQKVFDKNKDMMNNI